MRNLCLALVLVATAGCSDMGRPNWSAPGPAALQERRAEKFDPYPQDTSCGESVGVRPRDYDRPTLEPAPRRALPLPLPWSTNAVPR